MAGIMETPRLGSHCSGHCTDRQQGEISCSMEGKKEVLLPGSWDLSLWPPDTLEEHFSPAQVNEG